MNFFQKKILTGMPTECQTIYIQIGPRGYKTLSMLSSAEYEIILLINDKMPTIVAF